MLTDFLKSTAWEMIPPKPYGAFHLIFTVVGFAFCLFLAYKLRKSNEKQNKTILLICGLLLFIFELYKQLFYTYVIGEGHYQWWIFPFQLCSVPMYLCIIAAFLPECKIRRGMYNFMMSYNLLGGFIAFFEPSGLIHGYWTLTLHAFIWHMMLVFVGFYIGFSGRAANSKKDFFGSAATFVAMCVIAFAINMIFRKASGGSINMFYVGPSNSPIIVFKTICAKYGWYINTPLYILCMSAGAAIFYFPFYYYNKKKKKALKTN